MAESPRSRYASPSPRRNRSRSRSPRSPVRGYRGGSREEIREVGNPGNNLYVTGLSTRVSEKDLEEHFSKEGKVLECRLVVDPRTRESRGFGFVTMDNLEDAERSIKYLNRSILEGRVITVEKAKRKRARTPTPGKYLGVRSSREITNPHDNHRRRGRDDSHDSARRSPRYSPYRGGREYPSGDYKRDRDRSYSPRTTPPRSSRYERERSRRSSSLTPSRSRSLSPGRYR